MRLRLRKIQSYSDSELLSKYQTTEDSYYVGALYERYIELVYGVCLKYLKQPTDAQDAIMQIFENLQNTLLSQQINNFKSWLYVVAKNFCLMQIRQKTNKLIIVDDMKNIYSNFMEYEPELHPLDKELEHDNEKALKECIEKLRVTQKMSVELFYFKELTYEQISKEMSIEIKKVKSYLQNAKRNLKICLEQKHV